MNWLGSIVVSILSGISGLLLAGFIANACISWYHVTSREGASGYFVMFFGLGGGLAGFLVGLITARNIASSYGPGFGKELGGALGVVLAIAGVAAWLCRILADVPPEIDGQRLNLEVEFRFPEAPKSENAPTANGEWKVTLGSLAGHTRRTWEDGEVKTNAARWQEGRWIVPATVLLFTERGKRTVTLQNGDKAAAGFLVPLPRRPGRSFEEWSEWLPRQSADGQPWPSDKMSYRFRVQKEVPPPPAPTYAEIMAEEAAKEEVEFASIPADAPIQRWLPYRQKDQFKDRALASILKRPNLNKELSEVAVDEDAEVAGDGMRLVAHHPNPTADLIPAIQAGGRDIAERARKFNATTVEQDPSYMGAANVSIRFHGWMEAVHTLRAKCGGDFTPELKTLLELSRVRRDSHVMQADICRVASYYLQQWAGIAPLPGDPKPN